MSNTSTLHPPRKTKPEISLEKPSFFIIDKLLHSRMEKGFPTNQKFPDEDVNIYLAHLITSLMKPRYQEDICKYVIPYDTRLFETLRTVNNPRLKYKIYKLNADYLLIMSGIFDNPRGRRPHSRRHFHTGRDTFVGRGKAYYSIASSFLRQATRTISSLSEVLQKLADGFEDYMGVLSYMRGEYLNIIRKISTGEIYHFKNSICPDVAEEELKKLYDEFLDIYSEHIRNPSPRTRASLEHTTAKIKQIQPDFKFEIKN